MSSHGIRFRGTQFWIRHRRREYGPFDYEWARDFGGVELIYRGEKFGEYCSPGELYADLKSARLPQTVVEVGSIVLGSIVYGVLHSLGPEERQEFLESRLCETGYERFAGDAISGNFSF